MKIRIDQASDIQELFYRHDPDNSHKALLKMLKILEIEYKMVAINKIKIDKECINDDFLIKGDIN